VGVRSIARKAGIALPTEAAMGWKRGFAEGNPAPGRARKSSEEVCGGKGPLNVTGLERKIFSEKPQMQGIGREENQSTAESGPKYLTKDIQKKNFFGGLSVRETARCRQKKLMLGRLTNPEHSYGVPEGSMGFKGVDKDSNRKVPSPG